MRVELSALVALGLCAATLAAEPEVTGASMQPPDAALLEFLADWTDADRHWLEAEMNRTQSQDTAAPHPQETKHD